MKALNIMLGLTAFVTLCAPSANAEDVLQKPNVLLIAVDDLNAHVLFDI